jgi:Homeodomain-like domain
MRARAEIEKALALLAVGLSDLDVSRRTGIPRSTIRDWRQKGAPRHRPGQRPKACPVCRPDDQELAVSEYVYLLGLYLGDGYVARLGRTYSLRIFLDASYPEIVEACKNAVSAVRPENRVWVGRRKTCRCDVVLAYSNHWPCLLPQVGAGRKHERAIRLVPWQEDLVCRDRQALIRGLIHSDGCRVVADDRGVMSVRYHFSNRSEDIKRIFCDSLDALGIDWTRPCDRQIAIYRKASTALLDDFVGPKR